MQYTIVLLAVFGVYLGWFYWNRARKVAAAGGADAYAMNLLRKQFGLGPNETVSDYWQGVSYIGPLRPDVSPGTLEKVALAAVNTVVVGRPIWVTVTDQGILAFASYDDSAGAVAAGVAGSEVGYEPLARFSPGSVYISPAEQAFAGSPHLANELEGQKFTDRHGNKVRYLLFHVQPVNDPSRALTFWIDPLAVPALAAFSGTTGAVRAA